MMTIILSCICILLLLIISWFISKFIRERRHIHEFLIILKDIKSGNLSRNIISYENDMLAAIGYEINAITSLFKIELEEAEKLKRSNQQLLASLSHDIKTPLTTLIGYLDALDSKLANPEESEEYIAIASKKAQDLKNYIDMLFEWVKLDAKERIYYFIEMDLNEYTRSLIAEWIPQFEQKGFDYVIDIEEKESCAVIDANAYSRILENVISNALNHSKGNKITLSVHSENGIIQIRVIDNGIGISSDKIPFIFDRLYKCDPSRSHMSSGLGLFIAKELVHAMHGGIFVSSTPFDKTIFTITFPNILQNK